MLMVLPKLLLIKPTRAGERLRQRRVGRDNGASSHKAAMFEAAVVKRCQQFLDGDWETLFITAGLLEHERPARAGARAGAGGRRRAAAWADARAIVKLDAVRSALERDSKWIKEEDIQRIEEALREKDHLHVPARLQKRISMLMAAGEIGKAAQALMGEATLAPGDAETVRLLKELFPVHREEIAPRPVLGMADGFHAH